jgi:cell division protein FtsN
MKDNNLDDLIIDSSRTKKSGNKNILTIVVLFAIILLIAILLTKIMIDKPTVSPLADMNKTELANNDLLLDTNSSNAMDLNESNTTSQPAEVNSSINIGQVVKEESQEMQEVSKVEQKVETVKEVVKKVVPKVEQKVETVKESVKEVVKKVVPKVEQKVETVKESVKEVVKKVVPKVEQKVESVKEVVKKETQKAEVKKEVNSTGSYYIQAGAFGNAENVIKVETAIKNSGLEYKSLKREKGTKVMVGPFSSQEKAEAALKVVKSKVNKDAFIVKP